ncbi:MAG: hypothetical protein E7Z84_05735 [Methanosphaera stadtmanae]|nr:hypothetical protein [Methanosphaera stadtmanae]
MNGDSDNDNNPLIYCTDNDCKVFSSSWNGYYLNMDTHDTTKPIIKCLNGSCISESVEKENCGTGDTDQSVGGLIKSGSSIKICITDSSSTEIKIETSVTEPTYSSINLADASNFPGAENSGIQIIKFSGDGSVLLVVDETLPTCLSSSLTGNTGCHDSNNNLVKTCILNNKIYQTLDTACSILTSTTDAESNYYFTETLETIETSEITSSLDTMSMAYHCVFDVNNGNGYEVSQCQLIKGYVILSTVSIQCSGWKGERCVITAIPTDDVSCNSNNEGTLGGKCTTLCFGTDSIDLPDEDDEKQYIAFSPTTVSNIYGKGAGDAFILSLTKDLVMISSLSGNMKLKLLDLNYYLFLLLTFLLYIIIIIKYINYLF